MSKTFVFLFLIFSSVHSVANNISSHQLWKGVLIDTNAGIAYVINPNGGIDSLSIQTGLQLWHTDSADYPIMVKDSQLIAHSGNSEAGKISLVSLNTDSGKVIQNRSITIPKHIYPKVSHGLNQQFDISIDVEEPFSGKIQWQYKFEKTQGMLQESHLRAKVIQNYGEISLSENNLLAEAKSKTLTQKPNKKNAAIEGLFISGFNGRQFKSVTKDHILVSDLKSDPSVWNKYTWKIFDLDGDLLGSLDNNVSYNAYLVSGDVIIYVSSPYARFKKSGTIRAPLSVHAYSLSSSTHLWSKEIKDLKFQGQLPH